MKIEIGFVLSNAEINKIKSKAFNAGLPEPALKA